MKYLLLFVLFFLGCKHLSTYKQTRFIPQKTYYIKCGEFQGYICLALQESNTHVYCKVYKNYSDASSNVLILKGDLE